MRNIFKNLALLSVLFITFSCDKNPDNVVYELTDSPEFGAVLRTISIGNLLMNSSDPNSTFSVTVEEQDVENGGLMESVDVYVSMRDLTPDNGETPPSEAFVRTIQPSEFTPGPIEGLPRTTISMTFGEAASAMGLTSDNYTAGDIFVVELRLNLTDGRTFGASSSSGPLTGLYFNSPFKYNALLTCSPEPGDYVVKMFDSFGDGWQTDDGNGGSGITVDIDGTIVEVGMCSYWQESDFDCTPWDAGQAPGACGSSYCYTESQATVTIPAGTNSAAWNFPGDQYGEIRFEIYAPDGSLAFDSGDFGEAETGLIPVSVCAQ